jgi:phage terminase large subunit-like protein
MTDNATRSNTKAAQSSVRTAEFCDEVIKIGSNGKPFILAPHQREIFDLADNLFEQDLWNTLLYSTIKKSGKTELQAIAALKWALEHNDDELLLQGNDFDQAAGRVFKAVARLCKLNKIKCRILADRIIFPNGSEMRAIASDFAGEAGAQQGFDGVDEPWAVTSESGIRLLEELTPILTKPSIRFVSSYAGWLNQSRWLWDLYLEGVDKSVHPEGRAERIHETLPIFLNREARLFTYWDSGLDARRMPWQQGPRAEAYYRQQQRSMRAGAFARLHLNQWGTGDDKFITAEAWNSITDPNMRPLAQGGQLFGGWDASTKRDSTAVVFVCWDHGRIRIACYRIFTPKPGRPVDFEEVEAYVREVCSKHKVIKINCDPYQLYSTIQKLKKENFPVEEFNQSLPNLTMMATTINDRITQRTLVTYPADDLKAHALNAIAAESPRGMTIKKERAAGKIDSFIALSMAVMAAVEAGDKVVNPHAVPIGVGRSQFFGGIQNSAMVQPVPNSSFGEPLESGVGDIFSESYGGSGPKVLPDTEPKAKIFVDGEAEFQAHLERNGITEKQGGWVEPRKRHLPSID